MNHGNIGRPVEVSIGPLTLGGILGIPDGARGVVAFAHGSGSGRFSPRNQYVAQLLQRAGLATMLFDLLTEEESEDREQVFDIELLATRLLGATEWLSREPTSKDLVVGYFGASTGAGAALVAAAAVPDTVKAVVSRGGRPDLARTHLPLVRSPTLLIVGGYDTEVIRLNEKALRLLQCPKQLVIVPGATHLFEEPGTLDEVARLAQEWFTLHLGSATR